MKIVCFSCKLSKKNRLEKNQPCFYKIELNENIPKKYLNSSARNIQNKKKLKFLKKYIKNFDKLEVKENLKLLLLFQIKILYQEQKLAPAYIVFENYEKILNWNRSLRFALAVCTLKQGFENEI